MKKFDIYVYVTSQHKNIFYMNGKIYGDDA